MNALKTLKVAFHIFPGSICVDGEKSSAAPSVLSEVKRQQAHSSRHTEQTSLQVRTKSPRVKGKFLFYVNTHTGTHTLTLSICRRLRQ